VRGVSVGCAISRDLVEAAKRSELNAPIPDVHLLNEKPGRTMGVRFEVIDNQVVQVERSRAREHRSRQQLERVVNTWCVDSQVLPVVAERVSSKCSHVRDHLRSLKTIHGDLALGSAELEGCCRCSYDSTLRNPPSIPCPTIPNWDVVRHDWIGQN
jgi:hypothetical protein